MKKINLIKLSIMIFCIIIFNTRNVISQTIPIPGINSSQFNTGVSAIPFNTTLGLNVPDNKWQVRSFTRNAGVANGATPNATNGAWSGFLPAITCNRNGAWAGGGWTNARWISVDQNATPNAQINFYQYKYEVTMPSQDLCGNTIANNLNFIMDFYADNCIHSVTINGVAQNFTINQNASMNTSYGVRCFGDFITAASVNLSNGWVAGTNTIIVTVIDDAITNGGATGFLARLRPGTNIGNIKATSNIGFNNAFTQKLKEICNTEGNITLFSNVNGNYSSLKWQYSKNGGTWTDIASSNSLNYTLSSQTQGTYRYRLVVNQSPLGSTDPNCFSYSDEIVLNVIYCCEDPCSWSKTGNDNINPAHFLGTKNDAELNFKTNNELRFKIGNSIHPHFVAINNGNTDLGVAGVLATNTNGSGTQLGPRLHFSKSWGKDWAVGIESGVNHHFNIFENTWLNNNFANGTTPFIIQSGNSLSKTIIKAMNGGYRDIWPSGWGGGLATWDITCASIQGNGFQNLSDARLKKNIENFDSKGLEIVNKLNPVTYNWIDPNMPSRKIYGFKAQEVEKILPEIIEINNDEQKTLSMSYFDLIPISIQAIKELNTKVEKQNNAVVENESLKSDIATLKSENETMKEKFALLEKSIAALCENGCGGLKNTNTSSDVDALYQSIPNPTDDIALINYFMTKEYTDATIIINTQEGKQIQAYKLESKLGAGSIKVSLGELSSGTYLYTLTVGGRVVDTKRLQIVK